MREEVNIESKVLKIAKKAKQATKTLSKLSSDEKEKLLMEFSEALMKEKESVVKANKKDLKLASETGLSNAMIDRLRLDESRIENMAQCLKEIASLPDPAGEVIKMWRRPNGLRIGKLCVPIGVIGIIYESRPNVTSDCIGLCLKSGNSVILRGGKEAINSNLEIFEILHKKAVSLGLPEGCFNIIDITDRKAVEILLKASDYVDLIIPRGGGNLIRTVTQKSQIPVIKHYKGVCHIYVDEGADLKMSEEICLNAKVQKPCVCNAMETLLIHKNIAGVFLPKISKRLENSGVELRGCKLSRKLVKSVKKATEEDWYEEYLDLILSIKVVDNFQQAIDHINTYGSSHSDAIITKDYKRALRFLHEVDSACVYVNASTRFTDGNQFGLGAEMGISTDKIHARGPMGVKELTTYKYIILGDGQIRR